MHPIGSFAIRFFQTLSGRLRVILTPALLNESILRRNLGLFAHVNLS